MAKDWDVEATIQAILDKLALIAPDNRAMIPFAFSYEQNIWHVDVMVKRVGVEYDVHAEDANLRLALKGVYKRLGNWQLLERGGLI